MEEVASAFLSPTKYPSEMMKWSELPDDLLRRISEKLAIPDRIRFSAVCSGWRSGSAKIPQLHPNPNRQPPLLITFPSSSPSTAHLHSPLSPDPSADPIPVPIPDPPVGPLRCIIGSSHGWLITAVDGSIELLNPLTGSHIDIPLRDAKDEDGVDFLGGGDPRDIFFAGAALTSNPSRTNNYCLVLNPLGPNNLFVLFQSASNTWRAVPGAAAEYADVVCQDGYVHAATYWGQVDAWIVTPASVYEEMRFPGWIGTVVSRSQSLTHLVRTSASRELLQVWWEEEGGSTKVYKMDCRDLSLSEVWSLGDRALLLGKNLSVSVSTVDVPQLRRDCVYYLCDDVDGEGRLGFKICDLSNGATENGFFPVDVTSRINLEPPFWITPSYP